MAAHGARLPAPGRPDRAAPQRRRSRWCRWRARHAGRRGPQAPAERVFGARVVTTRSRSCATAASTNAALRHILAQRPRARIDRVRRRLDRQGRDRARAGAPRSAAFNREHGTRSTPACTCCPTWPAPPPAPLRDDYLIPSSILNATVSGLVSRSVSTRRSARRLPRLRATTTQFAPHDRSQPSPTNCGTAWRWNGRDDARSGGAIDRRGGDARAPAWRAMLALRHRRRQPGQARHRRSHARAAAARAAPAGAARPMAADVAHLRLLAEEKRVPVEIDPALPYHAVSLIRSASDGINRWARRCTCRPTTRTCCGIANGEKPAAGALADLLHRRRGRRPRPELGAVQPVGGAGEHAHGSAAERFVRVRSPEVLARVLAMPGVDKLTGFVIPKARATISTPISAWCAIPTTC
jgi:hypothetical protein